MKNNKLIPIFAFASLLTLTSCFNTVPPEEDESLTRVESVLNSLTFPSLIKTPFTITKSYPNNVIVSWEILSGDLELHNLNDSYKFTPLITGKEELEGQVKATITLNEAKETKVFDYTIEVDEEFKSDTQYVKLVYDNLTFPSIIESSFSQENLTEDNVRIAWSVDTTNITVSNVDLDTLFAVTRSTEKAIEGHATAIISKGEASSTKTFPFTITKKVKENITVYKTHFEDDEGFKAATNYNNTTERKVGPNEYPWQIMSGNISATPAGSPIDVNGIHMRKYSGGPSPYARTDFNVTNPTSIAFKARVRLTEPFALTLETRINNASWNTFKTVDLPSGVITSFNYDISVPGSYQFRWFVSTNATYTSTTGHFYIDDVEIRALGYPEDEFKVPGSSGDEPSEFIPPVNYPDGELLPKTYTGYYDNLTGTELNKLFANLREIVQNINRVSYADAKTHLPNTDVSLTDTDKTWGIYDNKLHERYWISGGTIWQREHVWPCSRMRIGNVSDYRPSESDRNHGSDLHNLRVISAGVNQSRSDKFFSTTGTKNSYNPSVNHKGDVARICFYMVTHYPQLSLVDDPSGYFQMGSLKEMVKWHIEDPVDQFEIDRNNVIFSVQGNRNPYIDNPDFVSYIFGS